MPSELMISLNVENEDYIAYSDVIELTGTEIFIVPFF